MAGQIRCRQARSAADACSGARGPSKYINRAQAGTCADAAPCLGGRDLVDLSGQRGQPWPAGRGIRVVAPASVSHKVRHTPAEPASCRKVTEPSRPG